MLLLFCVCVCVCVCVHVHACMHALVYFSGEESCAVNKGGGTHTEV